MHGSGLQKYRPSMMTPNRSEHKKMSNRKKALMALSVSGILLWRNRDKIARLMRPSRVYDARDDLPGYGEDEPYESVIDLGRDDEIVDIPLD
jgi:hypothetical protein